MDSATRPARINFRHALPGELPEGLACTHTEREGEITLIAHPEHATARLLADLLDKHADISDAERWHQEWTDDPDRLTPPAKARRQIASATWILVPPEQMPPGETCVLIEGAGHVTWWILETEATQQLMDELNTWMLIIVGSGLWVQDWPAGED